MTSFELILYLNEISCRVSCELQKKFDSNTGSWHARWNIYTKLTIFLYLSILTPSSFFHSLASSTLGARGFSCAVSGFGQVLKSLRPNTCRPAADETKLLVAREKKPGTQGKRRSTDPDFWHFPRKKSYDAVKPFSLEIILLIWEMSIVTV